MKLMQSMKVDARQNDDCIKLSDLWGEGGKDVGSLLLLNITISCFQRTAY